jgi:hypothetical protein
MHIGAISMSRHQNFRRHYYDRIEYTYSSSSLVDCDACTSVGSLGGCSDHALNVDFVRAHPFFSGLFLGHPLLYYVGFASASFLY